MAAEIELMKTLKHKNIMSCIDSYKEPKRFIVVMEMAQTDLWRYIREAKT